MTKKADQVDEGRGSGEAAMTVSGPTLLAFDEWAAQQPVAWRIMVAGFQRSLGDDSNEARSQAEWAERFDAWQRAEP